MMAFLGRPLAIAANVKPAASISRGGSVGSNLLWPWRDGGGPGVSFRINLPCNLEVHFSFPEDYPQSEAAKVNIICSGNLARSQHEELEAAAANAARQSLGQESVLQVLNSVQDVAWKQFDESDSNSQVQHQSEEADEQGCEASIERKLFWFHHIMSSRKKKSIVEWSKELNVGGYCKPGFPGILVVEGENGSLGEYVKRVRHLRWQAMALRAMEEEKIPGNKSLDAARRFTSARVELLRDDSMSELGALCRQAGLEHMFMTALKLGVGRNSSC